MATVDMPRPDAKARISYNWPQPWNARRKIVKWMLV